MIDSLSVKNANFSLSNILLNTFNTSREEIAILDTKSQFVHINTSYLKTIGYSKKDSMLGLSYEHFKGQACEQAEIFKQQDQKVLKQNKSFEFLAYHRYADGHWKLLHGEKSCVYDSDNQPCGIFSRAKDVSNHPLFDISRFLIKEPSSKFGKIYRQSFVYQIHRTPHYSSLSRKELEVLFYFIRGKTASEIALTLHRSKRTIDMHIESIKNKLSVNCKSSLIEKAIIEGYMNILPDTILEKNHD